MYATVATAVATAARPSPCVGLLASVHDARSTLDTSARHGAAGLGMARRGLARLDNPTLSAPARPFPTLTTPEERGSFPNRWGPRSLEDWSDPDQDASTSLSRIRSGSIRDMLIRQSALVTVWALVGLRRAGRLLLRTSAPRPLPVPVWVGLVVERASRRAGVARCGLASSGVRRDGRSGPAGHPGLAEGPGRAAPAAGGHSRVVGPEALPAGGRGIVPAVPQRPAIAAELRRSLMVEAGHRCAIPTCRAVAPLQIEHIDNWAKVKRHNFEDMIVLCANCHGRKGNGPGQIDRRSLRQYKANLAVINSRYGDLERRVLEHFAEQRDRYHFVFDGRSEVAEDWPRRLSVAIPGAMRLLMKYLVQDGYVELVPSGQQTVEVDDLGWDVVEVERVRFRVRRDVDHYRLTSLGLEFLDAWIGAQPIDGLNSPEEVSLRGV